MQIERTGDVQSAHTDATENVTHCCNQGFGRVFQVFKLSTCCTSSQVPMLIENAGPLPLTAWHFFSCENTLYSFHLQQRKVSCISFFFLFFLKRSSSSGIFRTPYCCQSNVHLSTFTQRREESQQTGKMHVFEASVLTHPHSFFISFHSNKSMSKYIVKCLCTCVGI